MSTVMVDHNYPTTNAMQVVDALGHPIESAEIRIFDFTAYYAGQTTTWEAETSSDIQGRWIAPVMLPAAGSWVVHFQKLSEYGPAHIEITT